MSQVAKFSRQEKIIIAILTFVNFSHIMDFVIMMPLAPRMIRIFGISSTQFGLLLSSYTFAAGTMGFLSAFFLDRFDRRKALLFFFTGFGLATILCALSPSYITLLVSRTVTGAFGGVLSSICLAIISDMIPLNRRATAIGVLMLGFSFASVFGLPFGLYLTNLYDWHAPFMLLGVVSCVALFFVIKFVPPMRAHLQAARRSRRDILMSVTHDPNKILALIFMGCIILGQFTVISFLSASMVANNGLSETQLPLIYLVGGLCSIVSSPLAGHLSDRFGKKRVFYIGSTISLIPILIMTHADHMPLYAILLTSCLFFISMSARIIPAQTIVTSTTSMAERGGFMSFVSSMQNFSSSIASLLAGAIIVIQPNGSMLNYNYVGYLACGFTLTAILIVGRLRSVEGKV
jgi:MFS transporter, DHA1 family, inner membrane transport protein